MTITREQLELAAKAAGIPIYEWCERETDDTWHGARADSEEATVYWHPQQDHGQLHDLAMACGICIDPVFDQISDDGGLTWVNVDCQDFPSLAEAVITAAAEQQLAKEEKA